MVLERKLVSFALILALFILLENSSFAQSVTEDAQYIERDVCIIGGGSSGTYSAIRLRDQGFSVVVVEKEAELGGHTHTYVDPTTKIPVNWGVVVLHDIDIVRNYAASLNVTLGPLNTKQTLPVKFVDFAKDKLDTSFKPPNASKSDPLYLKELEKYPYLSSGFFLPDLVPEDLLITWGDWLKKYSLVDSSWQIYVQAQGFTNLLNQPAIYVLKLVGPDSLRSVLNNAWIAPKDGDMHEIYDNALAALGKNALLNSKVTMVKRPATGPVEVSVTSGGSKRIIRAKQLIVAIPPIPENLLPLDLDASEQSLFQQFNYSSYYTGLAKSTGIAAKGIIGYYNVDSSNSYGFLEGPGTLDIGLTADPGLIGFHYQSPTPLSIDEVKNKIATNIISLKHLGAEPNATDPTFVGLKAHVPFELVVSPEAIKDGFYKQLYGLQGCRNTHYTGAAWHTHDSSLLWNFTEHHVLPGVIANLR